MFRSILGNAIKTLQLPENSNLIYLHPPKQQAGSIYEM